MTVVVRSTPQHTAVVAAARQLTPRMRRVSLSGVTLDARPGQDVELVLADPDGRRYKRRYTVRNLRADGFDVDAVIHGAGPGARWAASATPGDPVRFAGPRGRVELHHADWHLFVGDESALPAIAELSAHAPGSVAVVEVADAAEEQPLAARTHWVHRDGHRAGTADLLEAALADLPPSALPAGTGRGYLLGESRAMIALRTVMGDYGLDADRLYVKGYWNAARRETGRRDSPTS